MKLLLCLLLLAALAPDPRLTARWTHPGQAVVSWQQPPGARLTCLSRLPTGGQAIHLRCWQDAPAGAISVALGGAETDYAFRPARGDVYRLWLDGREARAPLRGETRLPIARR